MLIDKFGSREIVPGFRGSLGLEMGGCDREGGRGVASAALFGYSTMAASNRLAAEVVDCILYILSRKSLRSASLIKNGRRRRFYIRLRPAKTAAP